MTATQIPKIPPRKPSLPSLDSVPLGPFSIEGLRTAPFPFALASDTGTSCSSSCSSLFIITSIFADSVLMMFFADSSSSSYWWAGGPSPGPFSPRFSYTGTSPLPGTRSAFSSSAPSAASSVADPLFLLAGALPDPSSFSNTKKTIPMNMMMAEKKKVPAMASTSRASLSPCTEHTSGAASSTNCVRRRLTVRPSSSGTIQAET
mmetsp:Transcript_27910/g.56194  ORF Transcript_27910/g.56194 Transcript_27910/m.56194 type:complete len:204 (-) Transcript_27910:600-1211(-)